VDTAFIVRGDEPTPLSLILSKRDGTRSVVNYRSRSSFLAADVVASDTVEAACMLFDGHEPSLSLALLEIARHRRVPTVLDAGSMHEGTRALAMEVDCLAASATFAREFCRTRDVQRALADLSSRHPCVIITLGAQGLIWARRGKKGRLPAFEVPVIDSTGAGDAFHGALALGMARGMEWTELLRFAAAVAALVCTGLGARAPLPRMASVLEMLHATKASR
jgi:Sugar kinases, ribokinase family